MSAGRLKSLEIAEAILEGLDLHMNDEAPGDAVSGQMIALGMVLMAGRKPEMTLLELEDMACGKLRLVMRQIHKNEEAQKPHR